MVGKDTAMKEIRAQCLSLPSHWCFVLALMWHTVRCWLKKFTLNWTFLREIRRKQDTYAVSQFRSDLPSSLQLMSISKHLSFVQYRISAKAENTIFLLQCCWNVASAVSFTFICISHLNTFNVLVFWLVFISQNVVTVILLISYHFLHDTVFRVVIVVA